MCYSTKKKIANCVKALMRHKEIRRITIHDIMDATDMSRQSFYYHFKDIYDVLEWIAVNDFAEAMRCDENTGLSDWMLLLLDVVRKDKFFYEKIVREIEWPKIMNSVKKPAEAQIQRMIHCDKNYLKLHKKEWQFCVEFLATSFSYYMMDYIYHRKNLSNEEILKDINFMLLMVENLHMSGTVAYSGPKDVAG